MKKIWAIFLISICIIAVIGTVNVAASIPRTLTHSVTITTVGDSLKVTEHLEFKNTGSEDVNALSLWIQNEAQTPIEIVSVEKNLKIAPTVSGNLYICNLTQYNSSLKPGQTMQMQVSYTLPADCDTFDKIAVYDTAVFSVSYDGSIIGNGELLASNGLVSFLLYKPLEAPLNPLYLFVILLLMILVIITTLLLLKKQRTKVKKNAQMESDELLSTKKSLLLTLLKEIEKQHRSKEISDETYNKLKEVYKQQAVDVMKKLDDRKPQKN